VPEELKVLRRAMVEAVPLHGLIPMSLTGIDGVPETPFR
jgi:hypothetical protein